MKRKRKSKKTPTAILAADLHIRGDTPVCRTDDYMPAQGKKIEFILNLSKKYECPVLVAGDFGDKATWGDELLNWTIEILNRCDHKEIIITPGQHDLLNHRIDMWDKRGIGVLHKKDYLKVLSYQELSNKEKLVDYLEVNGQTVYGFPYGLPIQNIDFSRYEIIGKKTALCHMMVIKSQQEKLWPDQRAHSGRWLLKKYPSYDLIVTGDNHQSFVVEHEGRLLVNPGSMMRMTAGQIDHKPSVYLWYAGDNTVERVYLPIEKNVISREHIEEKTERDERMTAYLEKLDTNHEIGLHYEKNLETHCKTNKTHKRVTAKIWEAME